MIRSCRTDLRRCLWNLRSDVLDETDFAEAIRKTVAPVAGSASVANIRIAGEVHAGTLNISVRDDGCGFDTSTRPGQTEGHFGLDGIAERVERLGGTFEIESSPGSGTYAVMSFSKTS